VKWGAEAWALELDYTGTTLAPGASLQINPDNSLGIFYQDWSTWDKSNDWSWLAGSNFQDNERVVLLDSQGKVLQGIAPDSVTSSMDRSPVDSVRVLTRDEKWSDAQWSGPSFRIENYGDTLKNFRVYYYYRESNPIAFPSKWQGPCVVTLDTLGNGLYRLVLDYAGTTLYPAQANVWVGDALVGLRREDWGIWNKSDDPSIATGSSWAENTRVEVFNSAGVKIYGDMGGLQ